MESKTNPSDFSLAVLSLRAARGPTFFVAFSDILALNSSFVSQQQGSLVNTNKKFSWKLLAEFLSEIFYVN